MLADSNASQLPPSSSRLSLYQEDLRLSVVPVLAALVAVGQVLIVAGELLDFPGAGTAALLLFALTAASAALHFWKPEFGRWCTLLVCTVTVLLLALWLQVPGTLPLLGLVVILAAGISGLRQVIIVAAIQTALLALLNGAVAEARGSAELAIAACTVWIAALVVRAIYQPVLDLADWSWRQFEGATRLLSEARDRQMELKQALEDLAQANRQLALVNEKLAVARRVAEEAESAKAAFVANVSHELRTPLNMIIGFSEMMTQSPETYGRPLPAALLSDLSVIQRNSRHLANLVDDVLDLSQIAAGRMALTKEYVDLHEIVESVQATMSRLFVSKGLYLDLDIPSELPLVFCDRTRIREVVLNLLSNAARFTERGGVRLEVRFDGNEIRVSVADTGPGIAREDIGRLFRPFQQLDVTQRRRHAGSGLGLSISKSFVELHGGRMWIESIKGKGTTINFTLPIEPVVSGESSAAGWADAEWEYRQRTRPSRAPRAVVRPRLLVLENERGRPLQRLLTRYVHTCDVASVATVADAAVELAQTPVQALMMNSHSVGQALDRLIHDQSLPNGLAAIICSLPGASETAAGLGVSDYLVKPIARDRLLATVERVCPHGKRVLIVEDEPEALRLYWRILESAGRGYEIMTAPNGRQALVMMRSRPDVVLLDLAMPEMDGFQVLAQMRADKTLHDTPVVVISARDPLGHPVVSSGLAVTRGGGLTAHQVLACIEALRNILSPGSAPVDQAPPAEPAG